MTFSPARLALACLLALSLGAKLAFSAAPPGPDPAATAAAASSALARAGFDAQVVRMDRSPGILVTAQRGGCRLLAGDYPVHGTFAAVYRGLAAPLGTLRFVHRGRMHARAPKLAGLADFYLWRELRRIGVAARRAPVVAVAASPACDLARIDWAPAARVDR